MTITEIPRIGISTVLADDQGTRYLVVAVYPRPQSMSLPDEARVFGLVRIPDGMTPQDLGRRFRWVPTPTDATRPERIP